VSSEVDAWVGQCPLPCGLSIDTLGREEDDVFGRRHYQYYTNLSHRTCERCLAWHGTIRRRPEAFPDHQDGCERSILPIPSRELRKYRKKSRRMKEAAQAELVRRKIFAEASNLLSENASVAIDRFQQAAAIDIFVPDLEGLAETHCDLLRGNPPLREALRATFVKAYSDKFGWRRYERLPEMMRLEREAAGIGRINELFG